MHENISLETILFPKDKSTCTHIVFDDTFIPIKEEDRLIGCLMKCANCGHQKYLKGLKKYWDWST